MFKKILALCMPLILLFAFTACSDNSKQESNSTVLSSETEIQSEVNENNTKINNDSDASILIAYFSWSGNTKQLAEIIHKEVGGDMFEIEPKIPYTDNINELSGIALQEQRDNARPELNNHIGDIDKYDIIFVGYPSWWSDAPMPIYTFLEEYNFKEKTIIPFSTYGESGFGRSIDSIKSIATDSTILDGLAIQEHELDEAQSKVTEWLKKINLLK